MAENVTDRPEFLSATDLWALSLPMLPKSVCCIRHQARLQNWSFEDWKLVHGGRMYRVDTMPAEIQAAVAAHYGKDSSHAVRPIVETCEGHAAEAAAMPVRPVPKALVPLLLAALGFALGRRGRPPIRSTPDAAAARVGSPR